MRTKVGRRWRRRPRAGAGRGYRPPTRRAATPGQAYVFSFWVAAEDGSGPPDVFRASFDGQTLRDLEDVGPFSYTRCSFEVSATSASSLVRFEGLSRLNDGAFFDLDDVSLAPAAVPEPSTLALGLAALGIAGATAIRIPSRHDRRAASRRRRKQL